VEAGGSLVQKRDEGSAQEMFLVDVAQWLARVMQYSSTHPSCAKYGEKTLASLSRALASSARLEYAIVKDGVLMGDIAATHRAVLTRVAPHLHARKVQVLRIVAGATIEELTAFIETLTLPVQTTFDRGGLVKLLIEHGVSRIQIDEIAHDIDPKEQAAQRRRKEVRGYFAEALRELRASRAIRGLTGEQLLELLEHPEQAALILEEDPAAVAEVVAGLCLMVRQEEARSGRALFPKLRTILLMLSPPSHARVLMGLPPLLGNFRLALVWAFAGLSEEDVARVTLPAMRAHSADVDLVLYALSVATPHDGKRLSTLRLVALRLHDLPDGDATDTELLTALTQPVDELDSAYRERQCLLEDARRALALRTSFAQAGQARADEAKPSLDTRRIMGELVRIASETSRFEGFCERLPTTATRLGAEGSADAILGILHGLNATSGAARAIATAAIARIATPALTARVLDDLAAAVEGGEGAVLGEHVAMLKVVASASPADVWERLERSENPVMQQHLLDALAGGGAALLPLVRSKLRASSWVVSRHAVALLPRIGGVPRDLATVARHPNEKVRHEVMRSLRSLPPDEATMELVVAYLTDTSQELRQAARSMLRADLLGPSAISVLERLADDGDQPEPLRRRCIEVLGRSALDAAADALLRLIQPRSLLELGTLRELAAVALRSSPAPKAAACFQLGLSSSVRRVRKACERAAGGG
jgi:hypothetical protein